MLILGKLIARIHKILYLKAIYFILFSLYFDRKLFK